MPKAAYTHSNNASFASLLAYTEHTFGLDALSTADADAYDYSQSFDDTQPPLPPLPRVHP